MSEDWDQYCEAYEAGGYLGGVVRDICTETREKMLAALTAARERAQSLQTELNHSVGLYDALVEDMAELELERQKTAADRDAAREENARLREALEYVERWEIPDAWAEDLGRFVPYAFQHGSIGAQRHMRDIARAALASTPRGGADEVTRFFKPDPEADARIEALIARQPKRPAAPVEGAKGAREYQVVCRNRICGVGVETVDFMPAHKNCPRCYEPLDIMSRASGAKTGEGEK